MLIKTGNSSNARGGQGGARSGGGVSLLEEKGHTGRLPGAPCRATSGLYRGGLTLIDQRNYSSRTTADRLETPPVLRPGP